MVYGHERDVWVEYVAVGMAAVEERRKGATYFGSSKKVQKKDKKEVRYDDLT